MNKNRQQVKKFYCPSDKRQQILKFDLLNNLIENNVLDESIPLTVFKIQARDTETHAVVTVTCYKTGNVLCMGHGNIFDLTTRLVSFYHKSMPINKSSPTRLKKSNLSKHAHPLGLECKGKTHPKGRVS